MRRNSIVTTLCLALALGQLGSVCANEFMPLGGFANDGEIE
jgi:hypothetical protein